jgi:SAM-dependent methyltransferase
MRSNLTWRRIPSSWLAASLALALATACRTGGPDGSRPHEKDRGSIPAAGGLAVPSPSPAPPRSEPSAPSPPASPEPVTNRDPHGNPDLAKYIEILQSRERVADLQVDVVLAKLALPDDAVVGDLGCGPGVFSLAFAKVCPNGVVYACDIEPAQLDQVREKIRAQGVRNVVPVLASADDPHFPPERLDVVFIADTYHHLEDRVAYMQRLQSVLKPGGRLVLLEYKPGNLPVGPPPEHKLATGVLEKELGEAGYVRVERFNTHPWHNFEIWRVRHSWER